MGSDAVLQAVLNERDCLRTELLQRFDHHLQLYAIIVSIVVGYAGPLLGTWSFDALVILPLVSTAFGYRYLWEQRVIGCITSYLLRMERETLPRLIGLRPHHDAHSASSQYWVGWEHYFRDYRPWPFHRVSSLLTFVGIPIIPSMLYCLSATSSVRPNYQRLPTGIYLGALLLNSVLAVHLGRQLMRGSQAADSAYSVQ